MTRYTKKLKRLMMEITQTQKMLEGYRLGTETALNCLGEGIIVVNESGKITTINPYALERLGYRADELLGSWFPRTVPAVDGRGNPLQDMERPIVRALTTGQPISEKVYYLRKDGTPMPVFITVSPVTQDGRPTGAIEVFRDLSSEEQLDLAKDEFVSLASHQLRTPATGVKLILDMLYQGDFGPLAPIQQNYLKKAMQSNDRQLDIIEDLLHVAQIVSGKMKLDLHPIDLIDLLNESRLEYLSIVNPRHQSLEFDLPPSCEAIVDSQKIRMVIDNLISNASKYSPEGSDIRLTLHKRARALDLSVTDHGIGIPSADISKLFTKFTRLSNTYTQNVSGSGLGLFLLKSIIELHHGQVLVRSEPGKGSTFTVSLPSRPISQEEPA